MDPLTQGVVGAIVAQACARRADTRIATLAGFGAGMLADADVFIRSDTDPLLFLDFHRHFTHALAFIPVGGLLAALLLWPFLRRRIDPRRLYLFTTLGYATHGLLDACTTYGTSLLWPFSDLRVAWQMIAVVDPFFTLPLLALMISAALRRAPARGRWAVVLGLGYLALGAVQRDRADAVLARVVAAEGHRIERGGVKPTLANLVVWRGVYEYAGRLHAVALRPGLLGPDQASPVGSIPAFRLDQQRPELALDSRLARDVQRFEHFSDGWLAAVPEQPDLVGDFRYAMLPDQLRPLWAIRVDDQRADRHAEFVTLREVQPGNLRRLLCMIAGRCLLPAGAAPPVVSSGGPP